MYVAILGHSPKHNRHRDQEVAEYSLQEGRCSDGRGGVHHQHSIQSVKQSDEEKLPLREPQVLLDGSRLDDRNHQRDYPKDNHEGERRKTENEVGVHDGDVAAATVGGVRRVVLGVAVRLRGARPQRERDILSDLAHDGQNCEGDGEKD